MRLKAAAEDFEVREATSLRIAKKPGPYRVYMLEKRGWNTVDALMRIAREHRVPFAQFAYGGKKDRHAVTFQYVTFAGNKDVSMETEGFRLRFLGYAGYPMAPAKILANHFKLVLREMTRSEAEAVPDGADRVWKTGAVNYFDDQRFGNMDRERGFIAEKMLQGRWEEALAIALTAVYPGEHKQARDRKRALREAWGNWEACGALAKTALEQRAFQRLQREPGAFQAVLATAHPEEVNLWIAAYQSFLWNETVRRLIRDWAPSVRQAPGVAGPYLFPGAPVPFLRDFVVPLPGRGMRFPAPFARHVMAEVLQERAVEWGALSSGEVLPGFACKASPREAFVRPQGLDMQGPEPDDRYPGKWKLTLRFRLPKGAYATMAVKAMAAAGAP